jgi:vitellogenic carboxypeptidase-like protein
MSCRGVSSAFLLVCTTLLLCVSVVVVGVDVSRRHHHGHGQHTTFDNSDSLLSHDDRQVQQALHHAMTDIQEDMVFADTDLSSLEKQESQWFESFLQESDNHPEAATPSPSPSPSTSPSTPSEPHPDSRVYGLPGLKTQRSYAGQLKYGIPRNKTCVHSTFYWFFEAMNGNTSSPILIWLQGGPGCSGFIGLFQEVGPLRFNKYGNPVRNPHTWNHEFAMLFIDNPVGTGFSDTNNPDLCAPRSVNESSVDLYEFLVTFYKKYPELSKRPLYFTGESFAGKYIPGIAYLIATRQGQPNSPLHVDGVAIGDGLTDPYSQTTTQSESAYAFGMINKRQRNQAKLIEAKVLQAIDAGKLKAANFLRGKLFDYLTNSAGGIPLKNVAQVSGHKNAKKRRKMFEKYFSIAKNRAKIHVPNEQLWRSCGPVQQRTYSRKYMDNDIMTSALFAVPTLIQNMRVLYYEGQFDLRDGPTQVRAWIDRLPWQGRKSFFSSPRTPFYIIKRKGLYRGRRFKHAIGKLAGTARQYQNLTHIVIPGAGHLAPQDQPVSTLEMITRFVNNEPWFHRDDRDVSYRKRKGKFAKPPKELLEAPQAKEWLATVELTREIANTPKSSIPKAPVRKPLPKKNPRPAQPSQ